MATSKGHVVDLDDKGNNVPAMHADIQLDEECTASLKGPDDDTMIGMTMGGICCCVFLPALILMNVISRNAAGAIVRFLVGDGGLPNERMLHYVLVWLFLPALIMMIVILTMSDGFSWVAYIDQSSGLCDDFGFVSAAARGSGL